MNYLVYGSSHILIDQEIEKIVANRPCERYSLEEVPFIEILENISYGSMFDNEKVLILKDFQVLLNSKKDQSDNLERLLKYLDNPSEKITIIFTSLEKLPARGVGKELSSKLKVIATPIITKPYELSKILGEIFRKEGYGITQNALNTFSEKVVSNYDIAINEFEKLKTIKGTNKLISEEDIEKHVSNYNVNDIFGFKDAIINKRIAKALDMLDDLETSKMEIVPLVVMLAKEYQVVYEIKLYSEERKNNDAISSELNNMHPYRVKLLREAASKYTRDELEKLILYLCNLDLALISRDNLGYEELKKFIMML